MSSFYGNGGGTSFDPSTLETIKTYICGVNQYNSTTGLPTISNPDQNTFYLVPGDNGYNEYYYKNGNWELFGSADNKFDLSDRMAKGIDDQGNVVTGAVKQGLIEDTDMEGQTLPANIASGQYSHAEGAQTTASGLASHAEGGETIASGMASHAEGLVTTASGLYSHAEGINTTASGDFSHAEGQDTIASGNKSHAEGLVTTASGQSSHAEGNYTIANHASQHVFGQYNVADDSSATASNRGNYVEIVGKGTANDARSNARTLDWSGNEVLAGKLTVGSGPTNNMDVATKQYVDQNSSSFDLSDRMAKGVDSSGIVVTGAIIEGSITGNYKNVAYGQYSHAEGYHTTANGASAHAEGYYSSASRTSSHAEGYYSSASGDSSHAEGYHSSASGAYSHAEGYYSNVSGAYSHVEGYYSIANHRSQHVFGEYNVADNSSANSENKGNYVEIVGNGINYQNRSNARTLDWSGNEKLAGSLTLGMGTANETTITAAQLSALLALSTAEGVTF